MAVDVLIATTGSLVGVVVGGLLAERQRIRAWTLDVSQKRRAERLEVYSEFVMAGRTWQARVLQPEVKIETGHGVPYASAGDAFAHAIRSLARIKLLADRAEIIESALSWEEALRHLSEERAAVYPTGPSTATMTRVQECERRFIAEARADLGSKGS